MQREFLDGHLAAFSRETRNDASLSFFYAAVGACAATSNTEPDSDFPSSNPDYPSYGERWGRHAFDGDACRQR